MNPCVWNPDPTGMEDPINGGYCGLKGELFFARPVSPYIK